MPLLVHRDVVEEERRDRERLGRGQHRDAALRIDSQDPLLVGDKEELAKRDDPLRIVQAGGERDGLIPLDDHHTAVAVLVELADDGDVDAAVETDRYRLWVLQTCHERFGKCSPRGR